MMRAHPVAWGGPNCAATEDRTVRQRTPAVSIVRLSGLSSTSYISICNNNRNINSVSDDNNYLDNTLLTTTKKKTESTPQ